MFSRAHLLINRDIEKLNKEKLWGIEVQKLSDESIFEWAVKICGLEGTAWEGGIFKLFLKFDEHYNVRPPNITFHTIPFHPNIDMVSGRPCIDFLDDWTQWNNSYSLASILQAVQIMLSNPVLEEALNPDAANMLLYSPQTYKQTIHDCVAASQRVEVGLIPHVSDSVTENRAKSTKQTQSPNNKPVQTTQRRSHQLSFDDYYRTWAGIATSKSNPDSRNPLLEAIKDKPKLQAAHTGIPLDELQTQMEKQFQEYNELVYGKFKEKKVSAEQSKDTKLEKINQMKKIYLKSKTPRKTPISLDEEEPWEGEVDDLVAWTNKLNVDTL